MSNDLEINGYSMLRAGFVTMFLVEILTLVWFIELLQPMPVVTNLSSYTNFVSDLFTLFTLMIVNFILVIIASIFLYKGFELLHKSTKSEKSFSDTEAFIHGNYGAGFVIFGIILSTLPSFFSTSSPFIFSTIYFSSIFIVVIMEIGGFWGMKRALELIGNKYNESLVNAGAILNIIPIVSIPGTLITAVGLTRVINKAKSSQIIIAQPLQPFSPTNVSQPIAQQSQPLSPINIPQLVNQIGLGVIKDNGEISLTLYSQVQGTIILAKIEGTSYFSVLSIPLQVGYNNVIINMGMKLNLVKSAIYKITLVISTPSATIPITVDVIYNP